MRTKKAFYNTLFGILFQIISIICAFILPRLILNSFGSSYNGLVSSIRQFLSWISILSAGIGGVTRAALYVPLAENNTHKISSIIIATESFMKKVATVFLVMLVFLSVFFPILVKDTFSFIFVFSLVLVLGINTFSQYYFGITYQTLLEADQRQYIYIIVRIVTTILGTLFAVILVKIGSGIRMVYLGSSIIYACNPIFLNIFVNRYYKINKNVKPDFTTVNQRWDAFAQEMAIMINSNTDLVVLTLFTNVKIVSVYTVYNMIINGVKQLLQTFTTGVGAAFGNMIAQGKSNDYLNKSLNLFEFIVINVTTILFSVTAMTIVAFVKVYVRGVNDVNYLRPEFGYAITLAAMFNCFRIPYQTIVYAAGKFKETRNGSVFEALINIILSIILVNKFGLIGVAIGTLIAAIFRTFQYAIYLSNNIIIRSKFIFIKNILISLSISLLSVLIFNKFFLTDVNGYLERLVLAIKGGLLVTVLIIIIDLIIYKSELFDLFRKLKSIFVRKIA